MENSFINYSTNQFDTDDQQILILDPIFNMATNPEYDDEDDELDNGEPIDDENNEDLDEQFPSEEDLKEEDFEIDPDIFIDDDDDDDDY